jgi:succinoglycan biosynthesis transport protein ExoP
MTNDDRLRGLPAPPGVADVFNNDDEDTIDLRHIWRVIYRYKWGILGLAVMVSALATLIVFAMSPIYRSTATIMVESKQIKVVSSIDEVSSVDATRSEYFQTQFEILKSRDLARKVAEKLNLRQNPEFMRKKDDKPDNGFDWKAWLPIDLPEPPPPSENDTMEGLLDDFASRLTVAPVRLTQLAKISFDASDKKLAMDVVTALGEEYIDSEMEARLEMTRKAGNWLASRLQSLRDKLTDSERRLQQYLEKENLVDVQGVLTISAKEMEATTSRLVEARKTRAEAETIYRKVVSLGDNLIKSVESIPEIFRDPVIQDLKRSEAEAQKNLFELAERYGASHPKMIAARSQMDTVNTQLRRQIASIVNGIKNSYDVARANEAELNAILGTNKGDIQSISRKHARLAELQREVESNRHLYELFFNRFKETSEAGDLQAAHARFVDKASTPVVPVKPNKKLIISLAFAASLVLGVVLAFILERLDASVRTPQDVEDKLSQTLLGTLPLIKEKLEKAVAFQFLIDRKGGFSESVRTIRTAVMLSNLDKTHKVLLVTSSTPGEGKSTTSVSIALALSQMERVLLIDADMRRPTIAKYCELPHRISGLSSALTRTEALEDCIHRLEDTSLDILPVGLIPHNPSELVASKTFADLMDQLEHRYDTIVIDSPPVHAVSDAQLLAQYATAAVYVVKFETTSSHVAREGLKRLQQTGIPVLGVVLNQVDIDKVSQVGGYYHGYYYYYNKGYYGVDEKKGSGASSTEQKTLPTSGNKEA